MRSLKMIGSALAAVLVLASSASATMWSPQGAVMAGHGAALTLTSGTFTVTCTISLFTKASGAVATTTNAAGVAAGPTFSGCSNNLGISPTHVTSASAWAATATSTTFVGLTNFNYSINWGGGVCEMTVTGVALPGNTWSNATHTLTFNPAASYPQDRTGFCPFTAATGSLASSITFPSSMVIT